MAGEKSILIDTSRCVGCYSCYSACKQWNDLPNRTTDTTPSGDMSTGRSIYPESWLQLNHAGINERPAFFPLMCLHCTDAPCVQHCPEKAISDHNGWKVISEELCIGCGTCVEVCPYDAVKLYKGESTRGIEKNKAYKCDGCTANYSDIPYCVQNCPTGALTFDNRLKILSEAEKRLSQLKKVFSSARIFGLDRHRGTNVIMVLQSKNQQNMIEGNTSNSQNEGLRLYRLLSLFTGRRKFFSNRMYRMLSLLTTGKRQV